MAGDIILTIGRQYGSGGREIGRKIAEKRGMAYYDKELLTLAAKESGMSEDIFEHYDETPASSLLYSLSMSASALGAGGVYANVPLHHQVFLAQFDAIKKIAEEGPCVLVGRCADYALEERDDVLSVFIHADLEDRIKNVAKLNELTDNKAKDLIHKTDKRRASYYNYYTNKKWGDAESYDICINSSKFGVDGCVKAIKDFLELEASLEE